MRILLNGVGRIGKAILRISNAYANFNIVAINELNSNIKNIAYSINYDSTYGRFEDKFYINDNYIENNTSRIEVLNHVNLEDIDVQKRNIDIIIDATGTVSDTSVLKNIDVKSIFLTYPNKNADINVVLGVNDDDLDINKHKVISTSSCNATALLPILKLLDDTYKINYGDIVTIHPLLNHQKTLDSNCVDSQDRNIECNFEFGRSATQNIIPSKTTTIKACEYILPHINSDIISSSSLRVPTATVGAINVTLGIENNCDKESLIKLLEEYEKNQMYKIVYNNYEALVSSDFEKEQFTSIVDHRFTDVKQNKMIKLVLWYDNEWGYASKVVDIINLINK